MDRYQNFGFLLKDVGRLYTRRFEERAHALALTLPQCKALAFLAKNEGVSQKRLAELIEVDPMSLVRMLDRMQADGWVERRSDPEDRRARCLCLTEKAKPLVDEIWRLAAETRAETLQGLATQEREVLMELLERLHANLLALKPLAAGGPGLDTEARGASSVR
jgi:MarR family transcriptional regulator, transcriptional regulator for hemolysin